ncbi:hypothetical protein PGT21_003092 [Puccinia graminis f. sp. tritici]|uniref:OTU domain-containing protein n=1 Tax=Puccinia graminis f. sp. tritici TaxID=56615 RepID=A0A5B0Q4L2_PUCGR|nr:hypothetical protein PGT21_003092 [Puccinia graminis f. sp. tritici]
MGHQMIARQPTNINYGSPQLQTSLSQPMLRKMLLLCFTSLIMAEVTLVAGMEGIKAGAKFSTSDLKPEHTASYDIKAGKAQEKIMGPTSKGNEKVGYAYPYYAPASPPIPVYQPERKSSLGRLASKLKNYYFSFKMEFERFCSFKWLKDLFRTNHHNNYPPPVFYPIYHLQPPFRPHYHHAQFPEPAWGEPLHSNIHHHAGQENEVFSPSDSSVQSTDRKIKEVVEKLRGTKVTAEIPSKNYWTPVEHLPEHYRTTDYIKEKNGLFRALAHFAYEDQEQYGRVRDELIAYIAKHPGQFEKYLTKKGEHDSIEVDDHLYRLSNGESIDGAELAAFSELYKLNLVVVSKKGDSVAAHQHVVDPSNNEFSGVILQDGHYQLLTHSKNPTIKIKS